MTPREWLYINEMEIIRNAAIAAAWIVPRNIVQGLFSALLIVSIVISTGSNVERPPDAVVSVVNLRRA